MLRPVLALWILRLTRGYAALLQKRAAGHASSTPARQFRVLLPCLLTVAAVTAPWSLSSAPQLASPESAAAHHWAFQPLSVVSPPPPSTDGSSHPIDTFLRARLADSGLQMAPQADRLTLARRLHLDMLGLPPEPGTVEAFLADANPAAWERLVDRVLGSPRLGERWAQHWLDVVRYADTHGFEVNTPRPNAWPYRDYVIGAFNEDKPYDRFVLDQLAGDVAGENAATGFLVAAPVLLPGQIGQDDASKRLARQDALDEIVDGTAKTFMALTLSCARCHDHMFDPLSQRDYYAFQAFFAGVEYGDRPLADGSSPEPPPLQASPATAGSGLNSAPAEPAASPMVFAGIFRAPDHTRVLRRGDPEQPGDAAPPAIPPVLGDLALPVDTSENARRLALAHWLASPENPLTSRVIVNRVWQGHFGQGLVNTPSDFGLHGAQPSHPALLDWLASELIRSGWSLKHLHRLILLSDAYRQSNRIDPHAEAVDTGCRLLWRFPSRRLEAEAIRDGILQVSGALQLGMGGPGFDFFTSRGGLDGFPPVETFATDGLRRMIYAHKVRMEPAPIFGAFDCPDAGQAQAQRSRSTTAIQALNLFNGGFVIDQAECFAARVRTESGPGAGAQVHRAFRLALARPPEPAEMEAARAAVELHGLEALCRSLFNSNEFLFLP